MRTVERPLRLLAAALLTLWLAALPGIAAADGTDDGAGDELAVEVAEPVSFTLDVAGAERVQIRALITSVAQRYGVDEGQMLRIAECESRLNPRVTGRDGAAGVFQVIPTTWTWASGRIGLAGASPYDPVANAEVAGWLLANVGASQWVCR
ncbi:MAG: transglycosylase SLT domain-containing protein [Chloroflexota bacterium]